MNTINTGLLDSEGEVTLKGTQGERTPENTQKERT